MKRVLSIALAGCTWPTLGMSAAVAFLPQLENDYGKARVIAEGDTRIVEDYITYPGPQGDDAKLK